MFALKKSSISLLSPLQTARVRGGVSECYDLSKRECKKTSGCTYSKSDKSCSPNEDVGDDGYDVEEDTECYDLSKRLCKKTPGCSYDKSSKACRSIEGSDDDGEDGEDEDNREYGKLKPLEPPSPTMDPPKGWSAMESKGVVSVSSSTKTRSYKNGSGFGGKSKKLKLHLHEACACYDSFPPWFDAEGGFYCFCI